jgi:chromosome partitioning protein
VGIDKRLVANSVYDILLSGLSAERAEVCLNAHFTIIPSSPDLAGASVELAGELARELRLKRALQPLTGRFDYVFIDCPPSLDLLTVNALVAATGVLIPLQCEYYALEGLTALLDTVHRIRDVLNPELQIEGLLRTMFDSRVGLANEVSGQLLKHFGAKVYRTIVPRNVRLAEAPSHGLPVVEYDRHCTGAQAYLALAGEMLRRHEMTKHSDAT